MFAKKIPSSDDGTTKTIASRKSNKKLPLAKKGVTIQKKKSSKSNKEKGKKKKDIMMNIEMDSTKEIPTASTAQLDDMQPSSSSTIPSWERRYEQLQEFHRLFGHSDVNRENELPGLTQWVYRQRKDYRSWQAGKTPIMLTDEKIALLNQLNFVWDKNQQGWESRYQELLDYQQDYGTVDVPTKYKTLGRWVTRQRLDYKTGILEPCRIEKLNEIGFIWDFKEWQFQSRLQELKAFQEKHGHLKIKVTDGEFGSWFYSRRKEYLQWLKGVNTTLSEEHRLALEDVGFSPELAKRRITLDAIDISWEDRYKELKQFKKKHGHVRVTRSYGTLGSWVNNQRRKRKSLSKGKVSKLNRLGFVWNVNEWMWDQKFKALEEFKAEYGHVNVPLSHGDLGDWVDLQRVQYALLERGDKTQLTPDRMSRLNELAFEWKRGESLKAEHDERWYRNLEALKEWKREHGTFNVPRLHAPLGQWTVTQRMHYKALLRGEPTVLTDERRAALDDIGFFDDMHEP